MMGVRFWNHLLWLLWLQNLDYLRNQIDTSLMRVNDCCDRNDYLDRGGERAPIALPNDSQMTLQYEVQSPSASSVS